MTYSFVKTHRMRKAAKLGTSAASPHKRNEGSAVQNDSTIPPPLPQPGIDVRAVVGFPGYAVCADGSVWTSLKQVGLGRGLGTRYEIGPEWKQLSPGCSRGYLFVNLRQDGKRRTVKVHRIVLEAFVGPPPFPNADACHNDGNRCNNQITNLRWDTRKGNLADKSKHGTNAGPRGEINGGAKLTAADVEEIKLAISGGETQKSIGFRFNVHRSTIGDISRGKSWR